MKYLRASLTICPRLGCKSAGGGTSSSERFPRRNWAVVILTRAVIVVAYVIALPSMHQFITNSSTPTTTDDQVSSVWSWPGLGRSESFYSMAVTMFSIGEILGALGAGKILQLFRYRHCFLCGLFLCIVGYLLYALTNAMQFWMILVARFVIGMSCGSLRAFEIAYIGKTAEQESAKQPQLDPKQRSRTGRCKRSKKTLKEKLFVIYSFASTLSYLIGPGVGSLMAVFPTVDPYHWGAWFAMAIAALYMVVFAVVFKEQKPCACRRPAILCSGLIKCGKESLNCSSSGSAMKWDYFLYGFLFVCTYMVGSGFVVLDTLLNPILSDHFGFTVADNSYFMFGVLTTLTAGSVLLCGSPMYAIAFLPISRSTESFFETLFQLFNPHCHFIALTFCFYSIYAVIPALQTHAKLAMQELGINSRKRLMLGYGMLITGAVIMSDWQSIGHDPCFTANNLSNNTLPLVNNVNVSLWHQNNSGHKADSSIDSTLGLLPVNASMYDSFPTNNSIDELLVKASYCKAQSSMDDTCYWNPLSRVTGKQCKECYPVCHSVQKSLNFIQFSIGITIFITAVPLSSVTLAVVASDFAPLRSQGTVAGVLTAAGGFARVVSPLWTDALYIASEKHTFPVMTIMFSAVVAVLCTFCALYNSLAPRPLKSSVYDNIENNNSELAVIIDGTDVDDPQEIESAEKPGEVIHSGHSSADKCLSATNTFPLLTEDRGEASEYEELYV